jgi:hypothetical protein
MKSSQRQNEQIIQNQSEKINLLYRQIVRQNRIIQKMSKEIQKIEYQSLRQNQTIQGISKLRLPFKHKNQQFLIQTMQSESETQFSHEEGIILNLKTHNQLTSIIITSSSSYSYSRFNILHFDDSYWFTEDTPNSFICIQFLKIATSLAGYSLRSSTNCFPNGWKLEASVDSQIWYLIDQQSDLNLFTQKNQSKHFKCNPNRAFSYFKFIQTEKNKKDSDEFA